MQELVHKERLPKFTTFLNTITKWHDEILRAIATGYTNGYVEGLNNRTKVLKRISYGVRNLERFRKIGFYISLTQKTKIRRTRLLIKVHFIFLTPTLDKEPKYWLDNLISY